MAERGQHAAPDDAIDRHVFDEKDMIGARPHFASCRATRDFGRHLGERRLDLEPETAAFAFDALDADRAAHGGDDLLADGKAEAGAAEAPVDAGIDLREFAKEFLSRLIRNADACVPDLEAQMRRLADRLAGDERESPNPCP